MIVFVVLVLVLISQQQSLFCIQAVQFRKLLVAFAALQVLVSEKQRS